jgi:hypothetical protein
VGDLVKSRARFLTVAGIATGAIVFLMGNPRIRSRVKELASGALGGVGAGRLTDADLASKIRSEVLSSHPAARVDINVEDRVAMLRGRAPSSGEISEIEQEVRKVSGITDVRNYLQQSDETTPSTAKPDETTTTTKQEEKAPGTAKQEQATPSTPGSPAASPAEGQTDATPQNKPSSDQT